MNIVKQEAEVLVVETRLVTSEARFAQKLLFGEPAPEKWAAGEHAVIDFLRAGKHITKGKFKDDAGEEHEQEHVDVYSPEAEAVVVLARAFFGNARALGAAGRREFPTGELVLVLKPEAKKTDPVPSEEPARPRRGRPEN